MLAGLFWGDNVVWELDGVAATPFYEAILTIQDEFDDLTWITLGAHGNGMLAAFPRMEVVDARPSGAHPGPMQVLRRVAERCDPRRRNLLLFDGLDRMVDSWGADLALRFFARCCPLLLELGAIAYWSMNTREVPSSLREVVEAVTQCVLRVDERSLVVIKAEGRAAGARGSLMHWHQANGQLELSATGVSGQVAASLRARRRSRDESAPTGGPSRGHAERYLPGRTGRAESVSATLVRLAAALGITVDDLLSGEDPAAYQIGRRTGDPRQAPEAVEALLAGGRGRPSVDLIRLGPRGFRAPPKAADGHGLTAVCAGLVQVQIGEIAPVIRHGEVLMSDAARVDGWQNLRDRDAMLFWIVSPATALASQPSDELWGELISRPRNRPASMTRATGAQLICGRCTLTSCCPIGSFPCPGSPATAV